MNPHPWSWRSAYPAPAKINLFLHVTGRRADGYHQLQTLFQLIDCSDILRFTPRRDGIICRTSTLPGVAPEDDLVVRAARLLCEATGHQAGVDIHVEKRLPLGGGLGGGSSDAATVLMALNHLWQLGLSRLRLQELGLTLGADVPVFIFGRNAWAEGVGEVLREIELPPAWYVVLAPAVQVPTAAIFAAPELVRDTPRIHWADWRPGQGRNDLQPIAVSRYPEVAKALDWLSQFAEARMSGSGACVFARFADQASAAAVMAQRPPAIQGWLAAGLTAHPLASLADS